MGAVYAQRGAELIRHGDAAAGSAPSATAWPAHDRYAPRSPRRWYRLLAGLTETHVKRRGIAMQAPPLFRDRPRPLQIILGGVVPFIFGAVVGIVLGVSAGAYWGLAGLAGLGGFLAGFEHQDGWG